MTERTILSGFGYGVLISEKRAAGFPKISFRWMQMSRREVVTLLIVPKN